MTFYFIRHFISIILKNQMAGLLVLKFQQNNIIVCKMQKAYI